MLLNWCVSFFLTTSFEQGPHKINTSLCHSQPIITPVKWHQGLTLYLVIVGLCFVWFLVFYVEGRFLMHTAQL